MTSTALDVVAIVLGLVLFLYAGAVETAVANLSRTRLQQLANAGRERARALEVMIEHPSHYLIAAQVLRTLAGVTTTAFVVALALDGAAGDRLNVLWTAIVTFVGLTLLLAFPRGIAVRDPERTLLTLYYPVRITSWFFGPLVTALNRIGGGAAALFGLRNVPETMVVSTDALHTHASAAREAGLIEESEQDMIDSIIELDKTTVREVMVPRLDVTALAASATVEAALEVISSKGYSRVPVYESSVDEIVGVLYAKDVLRALRAGALDDPAEPIARTPYFVPDSKKVDELLQDLQQKRVH
ncbi:MAG TPA: hemolysin family protein, partial [Chloroflexota bacterium]